MLKVLFRPPATAAGAHFQLLDLVRGLSAFAILFWHYHHFSFPVGATRPFPGYRSTEPLHEIFWPLYGYGKYAILFFWLLSGFVFAHVYTARRSTTRDFVVNRVARLYPAHLATLIAVALLQAFALARLGGHVIYQDNGWKEFLLQLAFASNWSPDSPYSFNAPIWTVSVEIPAYALFWLLLPVLFRLGIVLPAAITVTFGLAYVLAPGWHLLGAIQCFFAGTAIFIICRALDIRGRLATATLLIVLGLAGVSEDWMIRPIGALALCAALIIVLVVLEDRPRPAWLSRLDWLGEAGYGIYLWHFSIQLMLFLTVPGLGTRHSPSQSPWFLLLFLALAVGAGHLSYRLLERPSNRWLRNVLKRRAAPQSTTPATGV